MPCTEVFDAQESSYRDAVLPPGVKRRVAVEAGVPQCWWRYVGDSGRVVGIERFGASGKAEQLFVHFGLTAENVARVVGEML